MGCFQPQGPLEVRPGLGGKPVEPADLRGADCAGHTAVFIRPQSWETGWRELEIYFMVKMTYAINQVYESARKVGV